MSTLFTRVQDSPEGSGTGAVSPTFRVPSSPGTLLVATLATNGTEPFSAPSGWQLATAVPAKAGRLEQWYYPCNPGGIQRPAFSAASEAACSGGISEYSTPLNTAQVFESVGQNSGTAGVISVKSACGNVADVLGIASFAGFFSAPVPPGSTWAVPPGYTAQQGIDSGVTNPAISFASTDVTAGYQTVSSGFSDSAGLLAWAASYATFRCITTQHIAIDGGEMLTMVALDPTGQVLVAGGDVEGIWRTPDFGSNWQVSQAGLYEPGWHTIASIEWSQLEPGYVYACAGKSDADGGFLVSSDGGNTWALRSADVQFHGNGTASPPRPGSESYVADRSTGHLLAQDTSNGYLYAATYNGGVARSDNSKTPGTIWNVIGMSGTYLRAIVINPSSPQELWVGCWEFGGTGGVHHTTDAQSPRPQWAPFGSWPGSGLPGSVSDLKIIGRYLYATVMTGGIYRIPLTGGTWTQLAANYTKNSLWTTLDGYGDDNSHTIIAGCGNVSETQLAPANILRLTIPGTYPASGSIGYKVLARTGDTKIKISNLPPDGSTWWLAKSKWQFYLGGKNFTNPHVLVNPADTRQIYVAGAGGFFRSANGGEDWAIAVNGMPMAGWFTFAMDPNPDDPNHLVTSGPDFTSLDVADPTSNPAGVAGASPPGSGIESHAVAFDPVDYTVYVGSNTKYGKNAGGDVHYRPGKITGPIQWQKTGYAQHMPKGNCPMGIFAGHDGGGKYILVAAQGAGVQRALLSGGAWTWESADNTIGTGRNVGQMVTFAGGSPGYIYCFDRAKGVFRSDDYGKSWTPKPIWEAMVGDTTSGYLAVDPRALDELWVTTDDGVYVLRGANTGTVQGGQITPVRAKTITSGGGIAFCNGALYCVWTSGLSHPSPQLMMTIDSGTTWTDVGGSAFGSYNSRPGRLAISRTGLAVVNSECQDVGTYTQLT